MKRLLKNYWYVILILVSFIPLYFVLLEDEKEIIAENNIVLEEKEEIAENNKCYVDIKGEVKKNGVYEIDCDKRIVDVITLAGGLTKNADISLLNLSRKINDEMSIKIYSKNEIESAKKLLDSEVIEKIVEVEKIVEKECNCSNNDACNTDDIFINTDNSTDNFKVNINTASKEDLMTITGIGESKAIKIIEYRKNNKFKTIEDIKNVDGFGESTFEKIKEFITV